MKKFVFIFVTFSLQAYIISGEQDLTSSLQSLGNSLPGLGNIPGLPAGVLEGLPDIDEGEEIFKEKCLKNGNNESYSRAMEAKEEFQRCVKKLVNIEQIENEIEKAKPTGDLDTVFRRYCRKTPDLRNCISNFTESIDECLDVNEKPNKELALTITDALVNFICHKEGDRIALFIAEGGPECLKSKILNVQECMNETFSQYDMNSLNGTLQNVTKTHELLLDREQCARIDDVQKCIVDHLEDCSEPTPANIVNSLFNFVQKRTPCQQYKTNGSSTFLYSSTILSLLLPIIAYGLSKL